MAQDEFSRLLQTKDWLLLAHRFKEFMTRDSTINEDDYLFDAQMFFSLHKVNVYEFKLAEEDFEKLVQIIVVKYRKKRDLKIAFSYAKEFPKNEICKRVIQEYEREQAMIIEHSQSKEITLKQNDGISEADHTVSLFKSMQEYVFYRAVREVFQSYMVFPNVGINAVIDFDAIKYGLTRKERRFYFMGLIDCVVIDQENDYKPIKFIELDSITHDSKKQQENDRMKDKIIGLAGQKLYRIRRDDQEITEDEFKTLIRETIK